MKNQFNLKNLRSFILLLMSASSFAQIQESITVKIESGQTTKNYIGEKLESFVVEMYAMNYGNTLTFTKLNDQIVITNAQEPNAMIIIGTKDTLLIRELLYDEKVISSIEAIDFDLDNLSKNSAISSIRIDGKTSSYVVKLINENPEGVSLDKTYKLFGRLIIPADLTDIDTVFNSMADFFSQEDALLRIYSGAYAEETQPLMIGYLKTNALAKIESGIMWTPKDDENGKYDIYNKGEIIKTEIQNLSDFQETIIHYFEKNLPN